MKFDNLLITRFRGIKELNVYNFKDVNLFVGKNNSGKSSLLEAIFLSIGANNAELLRRIDLIRDFIATEPDDLRNVFYNLEFENVPTLISLFKNKIEQRTINISPYYSDILTEIESDDSTSRTFTDDIIGLRFVSNIQNIENQKDLLIESALVFKGRDLQVKLNEDYEEKLFGLLTKGGRSKGLVERLANLEKSKDTEWIVDSLKQIDNRIKRISVLNKLIYIDIGLKRLIPANLMGDGILSIINILASIAEARNGFIMIDEIENGLHYTSLRVLWEAINHARKKYNVQVFATTHSYENALTFAKTFINESTNEFNFYRVERKEDCHYITEYNNQELLNTIDHNWEIR